MLCYGKRRKGTRVLNEGKHALEGDSGRLRKSKRVSGIALSLITGGVLEMVKTLESSFLLMSPFYFIHSSTTLGPASSPCLPSYTI